MRILFATLASLTVAVAASITAIPAAARPPLAPQWQRVDVGTTQGLRGLDAVDRDTAWVGGSDGGVWRTTDGGATWVDVSPPNTAGLLFRDVEAKDADRVTVLAIGEGDASRIYRTDNAGADWDLTFVNDEPRAFYNCMDYYPGGRFGLAVSDPVDGKFRIIRTTNGGQSWDVLPSTDMPAAVDGEFNFAASGTCLVAVGKEAYMASGGAASRIYHSHDRGLTWSVTDSPIPATDAGGVFSLTFKNPRQGVAVGGDFLAPDNGVDASGFTDDGGTTWTSGGDLGGYRSGADYLHGTRRTVIAVGPSGSDISYDGGRTWTTFSEDGFDSVECTPDGACWASGSGGRVARLLR
ncbi:oxidoreductase [soil metagenome]